MISKMLMIGIVGSEEAKFTKVTERKAKRAIRKVLQFTHPGPVTLVSGGCHLGGIDIWAEEEAIKLKIPRRIHKPKNLTWGGPDGFMDRNLKIARDSDLVVVITVKKLPDTYEGLRFKSCYHCHTSDHVKSGGCWTAQKALKMGKRAGWIVI